MVLIINGESYGALHKAFFLINGVCSALYFATLFSRLFFD